MFDISSVQLDWQGLNLKLETGLIARQADGAVIATLGSTSVLCTVCASKSSDPTIDFFPLSVHYIEKAYAAGKVPGGFFKREGRPSEIEILNSILLNMPEYKELNKDYTEEEFESKFPDTLALPQVVLDGKVLGNANQTLKYLKEHRLI